MSRVNCGWTALGRALTLTLATGMALPSVAAAFCRTSTCTDCPRDPPTGCTIGGKPIAWRNSCVSFSMNRAATDELGLEGATALMAEAFAIWESARCGSDGEPPSIEVSNSFGPAQCARAQYSPTGGNANLIVFRNDVWPYVSQGHELAATSLTFDDDGAIYDADIEINATGTLGLPMTDGMNAESVIAFGVIPDQHDLLSVMVHEAGHFLGLDHSREENSLMLAELGAGQVRTQLTADDAAAICTAYPPDRDAPACEPAPRGGFASACDDTPLFGGCSVQPRGRGRLSWVELAWFASLAGALKLRRTRKRGER